MKFSFTTSGNGRKLDLQVFYGRAHAPNDVNNLHWNDEDCYCWHNFGLALKFLDGISAEEAIKRQSLSPLGVQKFLDLGLTNTIEQPVWLARMHATVWEHYGNHLFHLFDLSHPELWNQYTKYLEKYYKLLDEYFKSKGIPPSSYKPPLWKVC